MTKMQPSRLVLANGATFEGESPIWQEGSFFGEAVFTTGMTGYPESLTDPSYTGQLLCFTYPLIGNYGIPAPDSWESTRLHVAGVIIGHLSRHWSHQTAVQSLSHWLEAHEIPLICGVDTRRLTLSLREAGTMPGAITTKAHDPDDFFDPLQQHLVAKAGIQEPTQYPGNEKVVIAVDCGMKENIVRSLMSHNVTIKRVPHNYDYSEEAFDGIFLSNGPGDPQKCEETIAILRKAMCRDKPIFGICLGAQLLALAAGARTYKLPYGHRGHNQPCMHLQDKQCVMTSQNHGFAIEEKSLPPGWRVTYRNLNDGSVEGIGHETQPFSAVQFHPEACPGPTDSSNLFTTFCKQL